MLIPRLSTAQRNAITIIPTQGNSQKSSGNSGLRVEPTMHSGIPSHSHEEYPHTNQASEGFTDYEPAMRVIPRHGPLQRYITMFLFG